MLLITLLPVFAVSEPSSDVVSSQSSKSVKKVDLVEITGFAIKNNFSIRSKTQGLEEARAKISTARSTYFPRIGLAVGYDHKISPAGSESTNLSYIYGEWNLFNGFRDYYESQAASYEVDKLQSELEFEKFKVALKVESLFHLYLFKKTQIKLKERFIALNNSHLKFVGRTRRAGLSSNTDLMAFELKGPVLESELSVLRQEMGDALINLKALVGEEISGVEPIGELQHQHLKGTLMDYLSKIKEKSTHVKLALGDLNVAEAQTRKWRSGWLPRIDFETQTGYLHLDDIEDKSTGTLDKGRTHAKFMVVAKFDLFNGFATRSEYQEGVARRTKAELALKQAVLESITTMESRYRRLKTIEQRVDIEDVNKTRSEKFYSEMLQEYKRGIKNSLDLSDASENLANTLVRREEFKYDFIVQRLELEEALGTTVEVETVKD